MKTNFHHLIESVRKNIIKDKLDKGCIIGKRYGFDIRVSPKSLDRALKIMNTVFKILEAKGAAIKIVKEDYTCRTRVIISEETLEIDIYEKISMFKKKEKDSRDYSLYDHIPNGTLVFRIKNIYGTQREWPDGSKYKLEDKINEFVEGLYTAADRLKSNRAEREREKREWEEKQRKAEELQQIQQKEQERFNALESEAMSWHRSKIIRSYVEAATAAYIQKNGQIDKGCEFDQWKFWAMQQADFLNPLSQ